MNPTLYLVSYDLNKNKNYPALFTALEQLGAKKILFSEWLVRLENTSPKVVGDHLVQFLDSDDSIYICEVGAHAWRNTMTEPGSI